MAGSNSPTVSRVTEIEGTISKHRLIIDAMLLLSASGAMAQIAAGYNDATRACRQLEAAIVCGEVPRCGREG